MSQLRGQGDARDCRCCEGTEQRAPLPIYNRYGLPTLAYRSGTHAEYLDSMLAALSSADYPQLQGLRTRACDDFSIALLEAFAATADVLTFYQERLANEAFLRTATERQSVGELAKLIGYQLFRGVSASTDVVFTVSEPAALPPTAPLPVAVPAPQPVEIATGTRVQSIPGAAEMPQLYETDESLEARPQWNLLLPLARVDQNLAVGGTQLMIADADAPGVGDLVLLLGAAGGAIVQVSRVESEDAAAATRLVWDTGLPIGFSTASGYRALAVTQAAAVFGHAAVSWSALSIAARADYLGVSVQDYHERVDEDPSVAREWQGFTIYAPHSEKIYQPGPNVIQPTLEGVLAEVLATTEKVGKAAADAAMRSIPDTAIDASGALGGAVQATLQGLMSSNLGSTLSADTLAIKDAVVTLLTDLIPVADLATQDSPDSLSFTEPSLAELISAVIDLNNQDAGLTTGLNNVVNAVNTLVDTTTLGTNAGHLASVVSPVNLINQVLTELTAAFEPLGESAERLVGALDRLRIALADAAVSQALAGLVSSIAETAVMVGMVDTADDLHQLVRYVTAVGDLAVRTSPGVNLVAQFNEFLSSLETATTASMQGKLAFDNVVDVGSEAALLGVAAGAAGGAIALYPQLAPLLIINMAMAGAAESSAEAFSAAINRTLDRAMQPVAVPRPASHAGYTALQATIDLDRVYARLRPGMHVILSRPGAQRAFRVASVSRRTRAQFLLSAEVTRLVLEGEDLELFADGVRDTTVFVADRELSLPLVSESSAVAGRHLRLDRVVPELHVGRRILLSGFDSASGEARVETAFVESFRLVDDFRRSADPRLCELCFAEPLKFAYRRRDLRLFGNVAAASHGESTHEILGSGDATKPFQSFALKQSPLTYTSASTPDGVRSSLRILVNDVLWREVPFFLDEAPDARVYVTRLAASGALEVQFGDGVNGARLPTGSNNVRAAYRKGTGLAGRVRRAELSQLMSKPLGLDAAINPAATQGAADPESLDDARHNAPLTVLTLGRAVSLKDYEDFANAFAGIAKAQAAWFWDGRQRVILITVAGSDGMALDPAGATLSNLRDALRRQGDPHVSFSILTYRPAFFRTALRVVIDADGGEESVFATVNQRLRARFAFASRRFSQPVTLGELVHTVQQTAGVVAVDVARLYRDGRNPALNRRLLAEQASLDTEGQSSAAELLTLHPDALDSLEVLQ